MAQAQRVSGVQCLLAEGTLLHEWAEFSRAVIWQAEVDHYASKANRSGAELVAMYAIGATRLIHRKLASGIYNLARRELLAREDNL